MRPSRFTRRTSAGRRLATLSAPKRQIRVSRPASSAGLSTSIRRIRSSGSSEGPHFRPIGFFTPRQYSTWALSALARAVADPDHMAGGRIIIAGGRIDPRQRLLVAEQQRLVRGVEIGLAQFRMRFGIEADGAHEGERFGDPVGEFLVALDLRRILDEAEHPAVRIFEIGIAAGGKGTDQVQGRRRLPIGFDLAARIGRAGRRRKFDVVDDVAAIARQFDPVLLFGRTGARLGELPGDAADLDDRARPRQR